MSFSWGEARHRFIAFWVIYVDILVGDVEVPCQHHWLAFALEAFQISSEVEVPFVGAILVPFKRRAGVWHVDAHQEKLFKLECNRPPLSVVLRCSDVINHAYGLDLCKNDSTSVPSDRWLAAIPILQILSRKLILEILRDHSLFINFRLLTAQNHRFRLLEKFLNSVLLDDCPDAVHVPRPDRDIFVVCIIPFLDDRKRSLDDNAWSILELLLGLGYVLQKALFVSWSRRLLLLLRLL